MCRVYRAIVLGEFGIQEDKHVEMKYAQCAVRQSSKRAISGAPVASFPGVWE